MKLVRRFVRATAYFLFSLLAAALLSEVALRWADRSHLDGPHLKQAEFRQFMMNRLLALWTRTPGDDPFVPPIQVFADKNWQRDERLRYVFDHSRLPANRTWQSYDFLRSENLRNETTYKITSNSLGFRGIDHPRAKPPEVFRIIVLGDYHAFGHGVDDEQTYCAKLERKLNEERGGTTRFEVWNGGRQSGTAIIGLARSRFEIFDFQPDLVILDYGFVDPITWGDNIMIASLFAPDSGPIRFIVHALAPILGRSSLLQHLRNKANDIFTASNDYIDTTKATLRLMSQHGVRVILLREMENYIPIEKQRQLVGPEVSLVDVRDVFRRFGGDAPPDPSRSWVSEIDPAARDLEEYWQFHQDYYQLNSKGHELIAAALKTEVAEFVSKRRK